MRLFVAQHIPLSQALVYGESGGTELVRAWDAGFAQVQAPQGQNMSSSAAVLRALITSCCLPDTSLFGMQTTMLGMYAGCCRQRCVLSLSHSRGGGVGALCRRLGCLPSLRAERAASAGLVGVPGFGGPAIRSGNGRPASSRLRPCRRESAQTRAERKAVLAPTATRRFEPAAREGLRRDTLTSNASHDRAN